MKKVFLLVRYSILVDNTAQPTWEMSRHLSYADLRATLFDRDRLMQRGFLFEHITLPSIEANVRDWCDLKVIVFTSEELPAWHMDFLHRLCEEHPFMQICPLVSSPGRMEEAATRMIEAAVGEDEIYCTARVDDDDAIAKDWVDSLSPYIEVPYAGMAVSFPRGYSGYFDHEVGAVVDWFETYVPMTAVGLSLISSMQSDYKHIFDLKGCEHKKTDRLVPVILMAERCEYLRLLHDKASMFFGKSRQQSLDRVRSKAHANAELSDILRDIAVSPDLFAASRRSELRTEVSLMTRARRALSSLGRRTQRM